MVELPRSAELFHTPDGTGFADWRSTRQGRASGGRNAGGLNRARAAAYGQREATAITQAAQPAAPAPLPGPSGTLARPRSDAKAREVAFWVAQPGCGAASKRTPRPRRIPFPPIQRRCSPVCSRQVDRSLGRHPKPFPVAAVQKNRSRPAELIGCERNGLPELRLICWIVHEQGSATANIPLLNCSRSRPSMGQALRGEALLAPSWVGTHFPISTGLTARNNGSRRGSRCGHLVRSLFRPKS